MFRTIWQIIRDGLSQRITGIDKGNIQHLRADLRFRLAIVEYAYFGKSGKRVARCLDEIKSLLGDKATHRYLSALDPDLRTQFVERFQRARREHETGSHTPRKKAAKPVDVSSEVMSLSRLSLENLAPNVVPINTASKKPSDSEMTQQEERSARQD